MITPLATDRVFYDSPDSGHPTCMCSRCGNQIREDELPLRMWPTEPGDIGYDPTAKGGTELRYCQKCSGIEWSKKDDDFGDYYVPQDIPEDPQYHECIKCGRKPGSVAGRYIGISADGFCTICVARMQDDGLTNIQFLSQEED